MSRDRWVQEIQVNIREFYQMNEENNNRRSSTKEDGNISVEKISTGTTDGLPQIEKAQELGSKEEI